ncbi:MAG: tetratricopeptide repeat protein [Planctomycetaceae bacterium]
MTQFGAITHYLRLSVWPDALVLDYDAVVTRDMREIVPSAIFVGLLAAGAIVAIRDQRWLAFLGFIFFATLSPSSSVIPVVTQTVAEHRMYLALTAVVIVFIVLLWQACEWVARRSSSSGGSSPLQSIVAGVLLSVLALGLGGRTFARNAEYADAVRLWTTNVERAPDSVRPYIQLAMIHLDNAPREAVDWFDRAEEAFKRSRDRNRMTKFVEGHLPSIYSGRATARANLGEFDAALADFDRSLELDPSAFNVHVYRAIVLLQLKRDDEALVGITKALEIETGPEQLYIRGEVLRRKQRWDAAVADLDRAIEMDGGNPRFYESRGHCLTQLGRYPEAVQDFTQAIRIYPGFAKAWYGRGLAFAASDRHANAVQDYSQAIEIAPQSAEAYAARARSLLSLGQRELARRDVQTLDSLPGGADAELRELLDQASKPRHGDQPQQQRQN